MYSMTNLVEKQSPDLNDNWRNSDCNCLNKSLYYRVLTVLEKSLKFNGPCQGLEKYLNFKGPWKSPWIVCSAGYRF